jgi:hypothetical protein
MKRIFMVMAVPVLFACSARPDDGSPLLQMHTLWPTIERAMASMRTTNNSVPLALKARSTIDGFLLVKVMAGATNEIEDKVGRFCAALLILGETGDRSDLDRLSRFAEFRISDPDVQYITPLLPDVPVVKISSSTGESARKQFPACYALANIIKRNPGNNDKTLLDVATNEMVSSEGELRILGVMVDVHDEGVQEFSARVQNRFNRDSVSRSIQNMENGTIYYWSSKL